MPDTPDDRGATSSASPRHAKPEKGRPSPWWREVIVTLALGGLVLLVVFAMRQDRRGAGALQTHAVAPDFGYELTDGQRHTLTSHRGKPVVLVFWATWCGACRDEMPELDRLTRESQDRYTVLAVSREAPHVLSRFASVRQLAVLMGSDRAGRAFAEYGITSLPTTIIVDAHGRIDQDFSGGASYASLKRHLERLASD